MIVEANWGNFKAKFNGREEKAFEWLCSLLFYKEHDRPTGSLRYFNQAGIEAGPITVGNEVIGFQAKFISTNIVAYKAKLIAAIDTAKAKNPTLTQIYFYVNLEFGESKKAGVKDPPYKTDIEEYAKAAGLTITWKAASFFESPFVCETNANITQHFFTLDSSVLDFVGEIARHTAAVLDPIRSSITVEGRSIKIDRRDVVARLKDTLSKSSLVIVSGEGGVGKTAVIKDFLDEIKSSTSPTSIKYSKNMERSPSPTSFENTRSSRTNMSSLILLRNSLTSTSRRCFKSSCQIYAVADGRFSSRHDSGTSRTSNTPSLSFTTRRLNH
jgi:hypothetical protein